MAQMPQQVEIEKFIHGVLILQIKAETLVLKNLTGH